MSKPSNVTRGSARYERCIARLDEFDYEEADGEGFDGGSLAEDAEFIAHARTDLPALLAEVERLRDHLRAIRQVRDACVLGELTPLAAIVGIGSVLNALDGKR